MDRSVSVGTSRTPVSYDGGTATPQFLYANILTPTSLFLPVEASTLRRFASRRFTICPVFSVAPFYFCYLFFCVLLGFLKRLSLWVSLPRASGVSRVF